MASDFFNQVYAIAKKIPYGRVTTYGAIARYLGTGKSARVVGWALNACHVSREFIPAHRVVNRIGMLSGKNHFGTSGTMAQLLENEGVRIENDRVVDFQRLFWDPNTWL